MNNHSAELFLIDHINNDKWSISFHGYIFKNVVIYFTIHNIHHMRKSFLNVLNDNFR